MTAALRPGGFGAIVHATTASRYLRFAEAYRATFAPEATPFTSAEQVTDALRAAGVAPSSSTLRYTVGTGDRAVLEGFLQRCVFDDTVDLAAMETQEPLAGYLAACRDGRAHRFEQDVHVITWTAPA